MNLKRDFYKGLTNDVRYIREKVFVEEQGFQNEFDEIDDKATHLIITDNGKAVATGRLFISNTKENVYTIGRVAVLLEYRNLNLGNKVLEFLEEKAKEEGSHKIELSAQCEVQRFYEKNGYIAKGDIYYDEFCPHIQMEKIL
ncbi:Predicted N-acyltransferase, GNAT family [Desulfonispora thiosulfatigenes DSM 11270]|uniref:Predicted N-acyltransferase, GNAT family n=1 Tax=Desulfonispora thiosulfatigenes DSM 11270 TaxID=656914 RepID=A0A1W1UF06_DESTI|nr:GNAT family N-acetyltransferase [Desulfonispora thiosulfatigenes]SMB79629.1 Predicted N-acyltransferase, GNAT family [Desulfonispora thiosulfatigenes DSM 11270]